MRASTLFVATFALWIVAKGRGGAYWKLVTTSDAGAVSSSNPGGAAGSAPVSSLSGALPDMQKRADDLLKYYTGEK